MANFDVELNDEVENFTVEFGEIQRITVDDFDKLRNRPSYAGQTMTHETNIPEVPTAVSQLTNDADYQTGSEVESAISTAVGDEKDAREQADAGLSEDIGLVDGKVDAEVDARERADTALQGAIDDEETARKNADNGLQGQIDAITSSSDVVDIVGTYAELLQYPTAGLGDKDVIKVLQDETHNDAMSYYRWNKNSSTWSYIGSEGPYYTKSETNTLLGDKQDTLTAGSNVTIQNNTISATDTTYTAGNGITLTGTEFSADTTMLQPKLTAGDGINISAQNVISADIDPADFFTASETVDGTGSEMTLNNTIQAKIKSVQMDGDTYQQTYSGKNVFNENDLTFDRANVSANQIQLSTLATGIRFDTTYISTTGSPSITFNTGIDLTPLAGKTIRLKANFGEKGEARIIRLNNDSLSAETQNLTVSGDTISWVVPNDLGSSKWLGYGFRIVYPSNEKHTVDFTNVCLTIDNADMNYEPYTGGYNVPSPNPDYPQPIQVVTGDQTIKTTGKNLFNPNVNAVTEIHSSNASLSKSIIKDGIRITFGATLSQSSAYAALIFIVGTVQEYLGKTLTFTATTIPSAQNGTRTYIGTCNASGGNRSVKASADSTTVNISWTVEDDGNPYVMLAMYGTISHSAEAGDYMDYMYPQLEIGSATNYQPYQSQNHTIELGSVELSKIGTYRDNIHREGNDWYLHKEIGKVTLDGTEGWVTSSSGNFFSLADITDVIQVPTDQTAPMVSYYYTTTTRDSLYDATVDYGIGCNSNTSRIYIRNKDITTGTNFKNWLSSHNTTVYYALNTPTNTKITDATLISELDALADALGYKEKTIITVSATGTNLPAILEVSAYRNSLAGVLGVIGRAEVA